MLRSGRLKDGQKLVMEVGPGTYRVTETVPDGWELASIVCDDGDSTGALPSRKATFRLQAGEMVTCTFTNRGPAEVYLPVVLYKNR